MGVKILNLRGKIVSEIGNLLHVPIGLALNLPLEAGTLATHVS
jgi:hypothetical protein